MKQLIILLMVCFVGVGCNTKNLRETNVIMNEHKLDDCNCQFDLSGNSSPNDFFSRTKGAIYFIDSCRKYDVGDTVNLFK